MNRTALCIRMLQLLRSHSLMSTKDLAAELDTNPRNIREFKKELEEAGYTIHNVRGRFGGYTLDDQMSLSVPRLSADQLQTLREARDFIASSNDFTQSGEFSNVINAIIAQAMDDLAKPDKESVVDEEPVYLRGKDLSLNSVEVGYRDLLRQAEKENRVVEISYQSLDREEPKYHKIDPYHVFCINNSWYLIGWDHDYKAYRNFRISQGRMSNVRISDKLFRRDEAFRLENYIGHVSAFKGKVSIYKVAISPARERLMQEHYWGEEFHKTTESDQGWPVYSFIASDDRIVEENLFYFGDQIRLLCPRNQKEAYKKKLADTLALYIENKNEEKE